MAKFVFDMMKSNYRLIPIDVMHVIKTNYQLVLSYRKAYLCLQKAKEIVFGNPLDFYRRLKWYVDVLLKKNIGSHDVLDIAKDTNRFERFFFVFNTSLVDFRMENLCYFWMEYFCKVYTK